MSKNWPKLAFALMLFLLVASMTTFIDVDQAEASTNNDAGPALTSTVSPDLPEEESGELASPLQITEPTWAEAFLRGLQRKDFIGYTVALCLSVIALFLKYRKIRYLILIGSIIYLGFITGLRLSGLGGPSTFILSILGVHGSVKINTPWYMLWGFIILISLVAGRTFCGWMCPMGALQQLIFQRKFQIKTSSRIHGILRYSRYLILLALVVSVVLIPAGYWGNADPFRALYRFDWQLIPAILLGIVLLISLFVFAPWCKYVCPLGTVQAIFSKLSLFKVRLSPQACSDCKRCSRLDCDFLAITEGIKGVKPKINQLECTNCGECIAKCPEAAISLELPGRASNTANRGWVKYAVSAVMAAIIVVVLVGANVFQVSTAATTKAPSPTATPTAPATTAPETAATTPTTPEPTTESTTSVATTPATSEPPTTSAPAAATETEPQPSAEPEPTVMTELGLELAFITPTIAADEEITITVKTLPGATVFIQVVNPYTGTMSAWPKPADGGKIRVADADGMATWSWILYKMVGKGEGELHFLVTSNSDPAYTSQWKSNMSLRDMGTFAQRDDTIVSDMPWIVVKSNY